MDKIRRDLRHENVSVLRAGEVPTALFSSWKMAFVSATPKQVATWASVSAANDSTENLGETAEDQNRTAQFAQDILSLLMAGETKKGQVE